MKLWLLILLLPLLSGCLMGGGSMAKVIKELSRDPATVRVRFPTPYGVFELDRYVPGTNSQGVLLPLSGELRVK